MTKQTSDTSTDLDGDGNPIQPDVMPEIDDDAVVEARAEPAPAPEPEPPREEPRPKRKKKDRRSEIAQMFRDMRDKEIKGEDGSEPAETVDSRESLEPQNAPEPDQPPPQTADGNVTQDQRQVNEDVEITLKVDGREVRKKLSEVKALAQIGMAGENRLDEVKRLLQEAKALRSQPPENPPAPAAQGQHETQAPGQTEPRSTPAPEHQPAAVQVDQDKLRAIAERLQVGDTDEGTQALADYMSEIVTAAQARQPNLDPAQISNWVQDAVVQMQSKAEADAALERFADRYKPLVQNEDLAITSMTVLTREIMNDLRQVGVPEEQLAANKHDTRTLANWHRAARQTHRDLRSYDALLTDVGNYMVKTYNIPLDAQPSPPPSTQPSPQPRDPSQTAQQRLAQKRALPTQPRSASVRAPINQAPKPKTRADVLNEMRQKRGFAAR